MQKERQKYLTKWLNSKQLIAKKWIKVNVIFASISALCLVGQTFCFAKILDSLIIQHALPDTLIPEFAVFLLCLAIRSVLVYFREAVGFKCGEMIRTALRQEILDKISQLGAEQIKQKSAGHWASLMLEQVESLHNFYARFLPQQRLAMIVPMVILIAVFPINWIAGLIMLCTAPLVPIFMILAGFAAADASQRNMAVLAKLSGQFLDRLRGLETIRLFHQEEEQTQKIGESTEAFRRSTMDVLKKAFLSSAILEFFTAISIALMAVYFGFTYLGQLDFTTSVTLFSGFFCLTLAPEFYQPLRDLGSYYHDRASAIGSADELVNFLEMPVPTTSVSQENTQSGKIATNSEGKLDFINQDLVQDITIEAKDLVVLSPQGKALTQNLNFTLQPKSLTAIVGHSGAGKTSLLNTLLGFLPYEGSLTINGLELKKLDLTQYRKTIAWVGQNPILLQGTIKENLLLGDIKASDNEIKQALKLAQASEFVNKLGLDKTIGDFGLGISVGQAQRLAIARALLRNSSFLLLDEPTASLDAHCEQQVLQALNHMHQNCTTLMITHRIEDLKQCSQILVMQAGKLVQQGSFAELETQGYFAQLLQARKQDIA